MRETRQCRFLTVTPNSSRVSPLVMATSVRTLVTRAESSLCPNQCGKSFSIGFEKRLNEIFSCQFLLEAKNSSLLLRAVSKGLNMLLLLFFLFCLSSCVSFSLVSQELRACAPCPLLCFCCISVTVPTAPPTGLARVQHHFQGFHAITKHISQCNAKTKK